MQQVIYGDSYFYQKSSLHLNFLLQESGMAFSPLCLLQTSATSEH